MPEQNIEITDRQRNVHVAFEMLAVVVLVPMFLTTAMSEGPLTNTQRTVLVLAAIGTVLLDGTLAQKFVEEMPGEAV